MPERVTTHRAEREAGPGAYSAGVRHAIRTSTTEAPDAAARTAVEAATGRRVDATVHRGPEVETVLASLGAVGATVGRRVLLSASADSSVMRHELAHVAQADGRDADLDRPLVLGSSTSVEERDAEHLAGAARDPSRGVSDPQVIRRRIDGIEEDSWEKAERRKREAARAAEAAARLAKWRATVAEQEATDRGTQASDLREDVERSELAMLGARTRFLESIAQHLPEGFGADWAAARTALELLGPKPITAEIPPEIQDLIRPTLLAFYWGLRAWQVKRYFDARHAAQVAFSVWRMNQLPLGGTRFADRRPPPDTAPPAPPTRIVLDRLQRVEVATTTQEWNDVVARFGESTSLADEWALALARADSPQRLALEYSIGLHKRQSDLLQRRPNAKKIRAVFYPQEEYTTEAGVQRATGYPWFFYLYKVPGDPDWVLEDLTANKAVNVHDQTLHEGIEAFARSRHYLPDPVDPPVELWEQLNTKLRFPKGELHFTLPSGSHFRLKTTEPTSLSEYLGYAALALGLIALTLFTAGAGTAAGIAVIASAGVSIASTAANYAELDKHGLATDADRARAGLMIAVDLASAFTFGLGRVAAGAARAGQLASASARLAGRLFVPVARLSVGLELTQLFVMTEQFVSQWHAIGSQPGLTEDQRDAARRKLVLVGVATGALSFWSVRGTIRDIRASQRLPENDLVPGLATNQPRTIGPPAPTPDVQVPRTTDFRLGRAQVKEPVLDGTLAPNTIRVQLHRNRFGLVSEISIVHGPVPTGRTERAWKADLAHHQQIAAVAQRYSGLLGELRELLAQLTARITGRPRGPLVLQLEISKLEGRIQDRLRRLDRPGLSADEIRRYRRDVEAFSNQLEGHRRAMLRNDPRASHIAQEGVPDGHPVPPPGYTYKYDGVSKKWEIHPDHIDPRKPVYRVDRDPLTGLPTGRVSNAQQIADLRVVDLPINNPATVERLGRLGYTVKQVDGEIQILRTQAVPGVSVVPLRVVNGKVALDPEVHLDATTLGPATWYRKYFGQSLNTEDLIARHGPARTVTMKELEVTPGIARGGDEGLLRRGSQYGLLDYVRYHIFGPGTGVELTRIKLAPEAANQFANHKIEGFMRRLVRESGGKQKVFFSVDYTTFGGRDLRAFVDGMLKSGDQRILRLLARDQGRFEGFLKEIVYDIRVVDKAGKTQRYRASITIGPPGAAGAPTITTQAPTLVP